MLKSILVHEQHSIRSQIQTICQQLHELPPGELLCVRNGSYVKWFKSNGANPIYIPKRDRALAEKLAQKKFLSQKLATLKSQLGLIDCCLHSLTAEDTHAELFSANSCYRELLQSYFHTYPDKIQQWLNSPYKHNLSHPESLIHETCSGEYVRSKSEVMIANALFLNKVPFLYERGIQLSDITFFPDFTILHPKTMETYYWEHFGMMSDPYYRDNAYNKLKIYGNHNLIPSINLITTFETKTTPINSHKIENLIQEIFL